MTNRISSHSLTSGLALSKPEGRRRGLKGWFLGAAVLFGLLVAGCTQGAYPVDIFYEQHYQQSYRSQEPPRLTGVAGAVAFYPPAASTVTNTGAELFLVNCQMCHGVDAKGTGPVLNKMRQLQIPDLRHPRPDNLAGLGHRALSAGDQPALRARFGHAALRQTVERRGAHRHRPIHQHASQITGPRNLAVSEDPERMGVAPPAAVDI